MSAKCRSCHAPILWALTESGKRTPIDPASKQTRVLLYAIDQPGLILPAEQVVDGAVPMATMQPTYVSHFATCPSADEHRKETP